MKCYGKTCLLAACSLLAFLSLQPLQFWGTPAQRPRSTDGSQQKVASGATLAVDAAPSGGSCLVSVAVLLCLGGGFMRLFLHRACSPAACVPQMTSLRTSVGNPCQGTCLGSFQNVCHIRMNDEEDLDEEEDVSWEVWLLRGTPCSCMPRRWCPVPLDPSMWPSALRRSIVKFVSGAGVHWFRASSSGGSWRDLEAELPEADQKRATDERVLAHEHLLREIQQAMEGRMDALERTFEVRMEALLAQINNLHAQLQRVTTKGKTEAPACAGIQPPRGSPDIERPDIGFAPIGSAPPCTSAAGVGTDPTEIVPQETTSASWSVDRDTLVRITHCEVVLEDMVKQGGLSIVRRGQWQGRSVALKSPVQWHEVNTLQLVSRHPNIVGMLGIIEIGSEAVDLVMPWVEGGTLRQAMPTLGDPTPILKQISGAVYYCHDHFVGIFDLKPENVMLDGFQGAQLIDFGSSKTLPVEKGEIFCITPMYGSPHLYEFILGGDCTPSFVDDYWSLWVMAVELFTRTQPWEVQAEKGPKAIMKHIVKCIKHRRAFSPFTPVTLEQFLAVLGSLGAVGVEKEEHVSVFMKWSSLPVLVSSQPSG